MNSVVKALAEGTGAANAPKLFVLLAVRSAEDVLQPTMASWVAEHAFITHMSVGPLTAEAARELSSAVACDGRLPRDVLDCASAPPPAALLPPPPPMLTRQASARACLATPHHPPSTRHRRRADVVEHCEGVCLNIEQVPAPRRPTLSLAVPPWPWPALPDVVLLASR